MMGKGAAQQRGNVGLQLFPIGVQLGATPIPLSATLWGLPVALSWILTPPVRMPVALGLNLTLIVQLAARGKELKQV